MAGGFGRLVYQGGWFVGVIAAATLFFWVLPILVAKNVAGTAERVSVLPGVTDDGGLRSGLVMAVYPLLILTAIASIVVISGAAADVGADDSPDMEGDSGDGEETDDGNDIGDNDGGVDETDDGNESTNETGTDGNETLYGSEIVTIQVYNNEPYHSGNLVESGTMYLYDSLGRFIDKREIAYSPYMNVSNISAAHRFDGLIANETYTAYITNVTGWPDTNVTFEPQEKRFLNFSAGYNLNGTDTHRSVWTANFTEIPQTGRFIDGRYTAYAETGDAIHKTTNAEYDNPGGISGRWTDITYHDGATGTTYFKRTPGWEELPEKNFAGLDRPTIQNYIEDPIYLMNDPNRTFKGTVELNGTAVQNVVENDISKQVPQVDDAADALEGRTMHVYHTDGGIPEVHDLWFYVDAETKNVLRIKYGVDDIETGEPIWYVADFWNHGNVEEIDDDDVAELQD